MRCKKNYEKKVSYNIVFFALNFCCLDLSDFSKTPCTTGLHLGGLFLPMSLQILWCPGSPMSQGPYLRLSPLFWRLCTYLNYLFWKTPPRPAAASFLPLPWPYSVPPSAQRPFFFQAWVEKVGWPPGSRSPLRGWAGRVPGAADCDGRGWPGRCCPLVHFPIHAHTVHHLCGLSSGLIPALYQWWCRPTSEQRDVELRNHVVYHTARPVLLCKCFLSRVCLFFQVVLTPQTPVPDRVEAYPATWDY